MNRALRTTTWWCLVLLLAGLCGAAHAQQDTLARDLKAQGDQHMVDGDYAGALQAYDRAVGVEPTPALHYNRGRALQALQRYAEALDALERFEREAAPDLKARVTDLGQLLASLRERVTTLTARANVRSAQLRLDGERSLALPIQDLRIEAGQHEVEASAEGYESQRRTVVARGGQVLNLAFELARPDRAAVLVVNATAPGAAVWLGGRRVGHVPLELSLDPGEHALRLEHPDYLSAETRVVLEARERRELNVPMKQPRPVYKRWWFWTAAAVVAGGVVTASILATRSQDPVGGDIAPGVLVAPLELR